MFESSGFLPCEPTEAIEKFCSVINPSGNAFHPPILAALVRQRRERVGRGQMRYYLGVGIDVQKSYLLAFQRFLTETPNGFMPKCITFMTFAVGQFYSLQWLTKDKVWITLYVYRDKNLLPKLVIRGNNPLRVKRFAIAAGLPEPTWLDPNPYLTALVTTWMKGYKQ